MQTTFYTEGKHLLDPAGKKVILRGINKKSVQEESDPKGDTILLKYAKRNPTLFELFGQLQKSSSPWSSCSMPLATGLACMNWSNYWIRPEVVSFLQEHQAYLLL